MTPPCMTPKPLPVKGHNMSKTISTSILGIALTLTAPYAEGHALTEIEAEVLNRVRAENIGNNLRAAVAKENTGTSKEPAFSADALAKIEELAKSYDAEYVFTKRAAGEGRKSVDPIQSEARKLARSVITEKLRAAGRSTKDVEKEKLEAAIDQLAANADIQKRATKIVKDRQAIAASALEGLELDFDNIGSGEGDAPEAEG